MAWLLSLASSWLPDLWMIPAVASVGLWLYGWFAPGRVSSEIVRIGSIGLACLSIYLWCWSTATAACEARVTAATAAETARQQAIVGDALTQARAEGKAAMDAAAKARADLEAALDRLDHEPDPAPIKCGLSRRFGGALPH